MIWHVRGCLGGNCFLVSGVPVCRVLRKRSRAEEGRDQSGDFQQLLPNAVPLGALGAASWNQMPDAMTSGRQEREELIAAKKAEQEAFGASKGTQQAVANSLSRHKERSRMWIETGGMSVASRLRMAWYVLSCRPVEVVRRAPDSDTLFPQAP